MSNIAGAVRRRMGRRSLGLVGVLAALGAVLAGIAVADSGNPPASGYVPITPATKVFSGAIAAAKGVSAVAIGGTTTVPTNATAVQLSVAVKATHAGVLVVYPAADPTAPDSQNVSYGVGTTNATIQTTVGAKDEITIQNTGSASATVTADDLGYSTQVTASNIAPDGGTPGQVLINNGDGTAWAPAGGPAYEASNPTGFNGTWLGTSDEFVPIATQVVPAGSYEVIATGTNFNPANFTYTHCIVTSPAAITIADSWSTVDGSTGKDALVPFTVAGLVRTPTGGTIKLWCQDPNGTGNSFVYDASLIATQVSSATGTVTPSIERGSARTPPGIAAH